MGKYTCPKCDWVKELYYSDGDGIREVLDHENSHMKDTKEVIKEEKEKCPRCDGKGYISYTYTVDEPIDSNVSETDSGRN